MLKITLSSLLVLIALSAFAQTPQTYLLHGTQVDARAHTKINTHRARIQKAQQTRQAGSRWYDFYAAYDTLHNHIGITASDYLFSDSTIKVRYPSGYYPTDFTSVATILDPTSSVFNNLSVFTGTMKITKKDSYTIDSIGIWFIYHRNALIKTADTLALNVESSDSASDIRTSYFTPALFQTLYDSLGVSTADSVKFCLPLYDYKINELTGTKVTSYRIVLDSAFYTDSVSTDLFYIKIPLASPVICKAGKLFAMSMSFTPGYTWNANIDTLTNKNYLKFLSYQANGARTYPTYTNNDFNGSYFVPQGVRYNNDASWDGVYITQYAFVGGGTILPYNNLWFDFHATCAGCNTNMPCTTTPSITLLASPDTLCNGGYSYITATGASIYTWAPGATLNQTVGSTVVAAITATTTYTVTAVDTNGCTGEDSITIHIANSRSNGPTAYYIIYPDTTIPHTWILLNECSGTPPLSYIWNWGDGSPVSTGDTPSHVYAHGAYFNICVTVTDSFGCSNTYCNASTDILRTTNTPITVKVMTTASTGIQQLTPMLSAKIYPDPANDMLNVECAYVKPGMSLSLYNIIGSCVMTRIIYTKQNKLNISALPAGIYELLINDGTYNQVYKVIKTDN